MKRLLYIIILITAHQVTSWGYSLLKDINVNWLNGVITSSATYSFKHDENGIPKTFSPENSQSINKMRREAYLKAEKKSLEYLSSTIQNIRVDSNNLYKDLLKRSEYTQKSFSNLLDNKVQISALPSGFFSSKCIATLKMADLIQSLPYNFPNNDFPIYDNIRFKTDYTSLIIDTRGLSIKPMIFPSIYDEKGLEIYSKNHIDIKYGFKHGIVSYAYNEKIAANTKKAGKHPYYTVALKKSKGCPVISFKDIKKIFGSEITKSYLKKCNVIFIIDKKNKL